MAQTAIRDDSLKLARRLVDAIEAGDSHQTDDLIKALHDDRFDALYHEIGKLTRDVHDRVAGLSRDERLVSMAQQQIPDARTRLHYVVEKTEEAANRTLTAVETMLPASDGLITEAVRLHDRLRSGDAAAMRGEILAYLERVEADGQTLRGGLTEVLMAQEFQDLTGQVIKRTINLVGEIEEKLVELVRACGAVASGTVAHPAGHTAEHASSFGPAVRSDEQNVVSRQADVDELLANLGF